MTRKRSWCSVEGNIEDIMGKKKMTREFMMVNELPQSLFIRIKEEIFNYMTAILSVSKDKDGEKCELIGSGTFIKIGDYFGILTANHVVNNQLFQKSKKIGLVLQRKAHSYFVERDMITCISIGKKTGYGIGPDLSLILLSQPIVETIKATKSFWNIDKYKDKILEYSNKDLLKDLFCILGCPNVYTKELSPTDKFEDLTGLFGLNGFSGIENIREFDSFDYCDFLVKYDDITKPPSSFGGVSGAGLWHIELFKNSEDNIDYKRAILFGIAWCQTDIKNDIRKIICHGRISIYERIYDYL